MAHFIPDDEALAHQATGEDSRCWTLAESWNGNASVFAVYQLTYTPRQMATGEQLFYYVRAGDYCEVLTDLTE